MTYTSTYIPVNTSNYGITPVGNSKVYTQVYGDKSIELRHYGQTIAHLVLIEGDSSMIDKGYKIAIICCGEYSPNCANAFNNWLWQHLNARFTKEEIKNCFLVKVWAVLESDGNGGALRRGYYYDYRAFKGSAYGSPIVETNERHTEQIGASERGSKVDTEGTPDKATHYKGAVEPLEVMAKLLNKDEFIGFLKGNIIKYSYRAGRKQGESGEKDRNKFLVYSDWLHKVTNGEPIVLGDKTITFN